MRPILVLLILLGLAAAPALALSPSDLKPAMTAEESDYYDTIKADPSAAQSFLVTRDYVRKAQAVVSGSLPPLSFPGKRPAGFTVDYLLPDDPSTINEALGMYLAAALKANPHFLGQ